MSSKQASDTSANSSTAGEGANTPASHTSTSSHTHSVPIHSLRRLQSQQNMDDTTTKDPAPAADREEDAKPADAKAEQEPEDVAGKLGSSTKKAKCKKPEHKKQKKDKKKTSTSKKATKSASGSDSSSSDSSDSDSDSSSSEEEKAKKKSSKAKKSKKSKAKSSKKSKKAEAESDSSDSDSDDSSSDDSDAEAKAKLKKLKKAKQAKGKKLAKAKKASAESEEEDLDDDETEIAAQPDLDAELRAIESKIAALRLQQNASKMAALPKLSRAGRGRLSSLSGLSGLSGHTALSVLGRRGNLKMAKARQAKLAEAEEEEGESKYYKRVDQLWDSSIHNYKLKESAEEDESEFSDYAFLVRRTFNWENKYEDTVVDIKSKHLRLALQEVMKGCKSVSLEAKEPCIDPNLLFLYLDELRAFYKTDLKAKIKAERKRKAIKKLEQQRAHVKALVGYIDDDYADTKKTLYPLIKAGNITFDLMWALFKPNDIAVSSCYGNWDEPRCFKIDYANKCCSMMRGSWWCIEGSYLEYDGKAFGFGDFEVDIDSFKGPRKISSLATYPLKYHREEEKVRKQIVERGERFVAMAGMHYKFHKGLAFMKKKKQILKININGRVMLDPATFRRVNPNYQISYIKPKEAEGLFSLSDNEESDEDGCCSCEGSDDEDDGGRKDSSLQKKFDTDRPKYKYKWEKNERGNTVFMAVEIDEDGDPLQRNKAVDKLAEDANTKGRVFTEEELLLTSPVMLGFAFSEKLWLEFTISGVHDITWNEHAFDSLVLPPNQKSIVRALVESHKFSAHKAIDDVVQGKGKGLVSVLHGPPGTGKTLTAEGISELLKCPLYMVSAGELGTDPARLEHELQKILDIAHSWGAILLLDEADVFLEKREVHDIHRNALVSIFLRLLEYFQGILFLTTNRVETFDDAFQSRIHVALRYGELTHKAKRTVWTMFINMVRAEMDVSEDFGEQHIDVLARHELNGRQIKNLVRSAQALALHEKVPMGVEHVKRVVEVADSFSKDLRGGTGYIDAMRSYT